MSDKINVFQEIWRMIKKPWSTGFCLYFGLIIIILNGLGVICAFKYNKGTLIYSISQNLAIYSIALFVPSLISIVLQLIQDLIYNKVSFSIISITILAGEIYIIPQAYQGYLGYAIITTAIAWLYWIIANRDNEYLNDDSFDQIIKKGRSSHGKQWNQN